MGTLPTDHSSVRLNSFRLYFSRRCFFRLCPYRLCSYRLCSYRPPSAAPACPFDPWKQCEGGESQKERQEKVVGVPEVLRDCSGGRAG